MLVLDHPWLTTHPPANQTAEVDHLAAALAYAEQGMAVFPLAPRSKFPLISTEKGGRGLHDATTDLDQIRAWWSANRYANIGLKTGVTFDVVDLDSEAAVDALETVRNGRERITAPVAATAKGFHYFVRPTGLGNRAGVLPGVDFRGVGGYAVAPPSAHPSGVRYRWIVHEPIGPAPSWLLDLLAPERVPERPRVTQMRPERATAYGRVALRRSLERLAQAPVGTRNDQLNRSSFALGQLVATGALNEDETAAALIEAGQQLGLGVRECERTVASRLSAGIEQPRELGIG